MQSFTTPPSPSLLWWKCWRTLKMVSWLNARFPFDFSVRKTKPLAKVGFRWLWFYFAFLGDWILFFSKYGWERPTLYSQNNTCWLQKQKVGWKKVTIAIRKAHNFTLINKSLQRILRIQVHTVESRFFDYSIIRNSRFFEPKVVSLGFASVKRCNFTPDFSNARFFETPDISN